MTRNPCAVKGQAADSRRNRRAAIIPVSPRPLFRRLSRPVAEPRVELGQKRLRGLRDHRAGREDGGGARFCHIGT